MKLTADDLAADIRRIDGNHDMGADELADALFAAGWGHIAGQQGVIAEYIAARDDYEAATKPPNSHALPRVVSHGDPRVLRYREARTALATRSHQPPNPAGLMLIDTAVEAHIASKMYGPRYGIDWVYYCDKRGRLSEHEAFAQPPKPAGAVLLADGWEFTKGGGVTEVFDIALWDDLGGIWRDDETGLPVLREEGELKDWPSGKINAVLVQVSRALSSDEVQPETGERIESYGNAREAAAGGVPAMNKAEAYRAIKRALGDAIADDAEISIHDLTQCVVEAIPQQPTAEPAVGQNPLLVYSDGYRQMAKMGDGRVDCFSVAIDIEKNMAKHATWPARKPAVEATGIVCGYSSSHRTIEIWIDPEVPRWMIGDKIRVTISPTGGKSDA